MNSITRIAKKYPLATFATAAVAAYVLNKNFDKILTTGHNLTAKAEIKTPVHW